MSTQESERIPALTLGWRLKMALGEQSAQAMADTLGVSRQTLSRWMADKGAPPKKAYLSQWALATGVPVDWLEKGETPNGGPGPGSGLPADEKAERLAQLAASKRPRHAGGTTARYDRAA